MTGHDPKASRQSPSSEGAGEDATAERADATDTHPDDALHAHPPHGPAGYTPDPSSPDAPQRFWIIRHPIVTAILATLISASIVGVFDLLTHQRRSLETWLRGSQLTIEVDDEVNLFEEDGHFRMQATLNAHYTGWLAGPPLIEEVRARLYLADRVIELAGRERVVLVKDATGRLTGKYHETGPPLDFDGSAYVSPPILFDRGQRVDWADFTQWMRNEAIPDDREAQDCRARFDEGQSFVCYGWLSIELTAIEADNETPWARTRCDVWITWSRVQEIIHTGVDANYRITPPCAGLREAGRYLGAPPARLPRP